MTDADGNPKSENGPSGSPAPAHNVVPASFARHDVDVTAPDDARAEGAEEQATFDRHDVDVDAPDAVSEQGQATFDRHDVDVDAPDSVDTLDEATYDRHDNK